VLGKHFLGDNHIAVVEDTKKIFLSLFNDILPVVRKAVHNFAMGNFGYMVEGLTFGNSTNLLNKCVFTRHTQKGH
jgi:hypothetical protein